MRTAEQIKEDMRDAVSAHNTRVAQMTAHAAFRELSGLLLDSPLRFTCSSEFTRDDVAALLEQLAPYLALLAEVAPTLPTRADAQAQVAEAAE